MNFEGLQAYLDELIPRGIPAFECIVHQHYRPVFHYMRGFSDVEGRVPVSAQDRYWFYSATKIHTAVATMQLIEEGRLAPDDPLSHYLPEFARMRVMGEEGKTVAAKTPITIRHLLTMTAGFSYDLNSPSLREAKEKNPGAGTREMIAALAGEPLLFEPGTSFKYSLCHDVLAAVIEVVSGLRFGDYLRQRIFEPLGIRDMGFIPGGLAAQYRYDAKTKRAVPIVPNTNAYRLTEAYESGGAGLVGRAEEYIKLLDALAHGGVGENGTRILSEASVTLMRQNALEGAALEAYQNAFRKLGYGYGLGVRTMIDRRAAGTKAPLGEFGWGGAAGAYAMVDPFSGISVFYIQHVLSTGFIPHSVQPGIRDRVYAALEKR